MTCDRVIESVSEEAMKIKIMVYAERPESAAFEPVKTLCPIKNIPGRVRAEKRSAGETD